MSISSLLSVFHGFIISVFKTNDVTQFDRNALELFLARPDDVDAPNHTLVSERVKREVWTPLPASVFSVERLGGLY